MYQIFLDFVERISSRKFILALGLVLVLAADNVGLKLDPEIRKQLVTVILGYLVVEGGTDAIRAYRE